MYNYCIPYYRNYSLGDYADQKIGHLHSILRRAEPSQNAVRRCTGKERDVETGLHYYGARYYDSDLGRWLQVDPQADKYPGWSPYNYCVNNPVRNVDPDGKEVKVYTERLGSATLSHGGSLKGIAAIAFPRHSYMRVTTDKYDVVIELGGPKDGSKKGNPLMTSVKGELQPREGQTECNVDRPQGVGEKDYSKFEDKIVALFNVIKNNLPDYNALGANSNGFIRFLIETTGGGVDLPANAYSSKDIKEYWEKYKQSLEKSKKDEEAKKSE